MDKDYRDIRLAAQAAANEANRFRQEYALQEVSGKKVLAADKRLKMHIVELELSEITTNLLEGCNITTVGALLNCTRHQLLRIDNFGPAKLREVFDRLAELGFYRQSGPQSP